jgi:hypothetical protein
MRLRLLQNMPLAGAAVIGCALGMWYSGSRPAPELVAQATAAAWSGREELDQLLKARYETAKSLLELEEKRLREGVTTLGRVCDAARWVRDSAVELPVSAQERLAALTNYVAVTRRLQASVDRATAQGAAPPSDREWARYTRLDAEIMLLRTELRDSK